MTTFEDVFNAAQALPVEERRCLIDALWATTPEADLTESQKEELDRRLAAYRAAPNRGAPWEEVKARIAGQ